ncbi:MAG: UbiA family prenyltransferase [Desulfobacula sp.]|nr:UbiA family prenyltransferase [Desulfobacula sp.]
MIKKIVTVFELIRLPGMFTAHADILAAFLITGAGLGRFGSLIWILIASSCLFSAGMALNDYFDIEVDRKERPKRPIPSGRISGPAAGAIGFGLLVAGICAAGFAGLKPFAISLALAAAILLYDGLLKDYPVLGPLTMAACRYFNVLMGLSILPFEGWAYIPFITFLYIFGVTVLSKKEAAGGKAVKTVGVCALFLGCAALLYYYLFLIRILPVFTGAFLMMAFAVFLSGRVLSLLTHHSPLDFQAAMKLLLLSIIILDTILASGSVPVYAAAPILLLYVPAVLSARLFRVT